MKKGIKNRGWCNWPNREYKDDCESFARMAIRCDVWRAFFSSRLSDRLGRLKGRIIWFNRHEAFDKLLCEFDCSERLITQILGSFMRPGHEREIVFRRCDIYDKRAWTHLPLNCFIDTETLEPRGPTSERWLDMTEALRMNEVPLLSFSIPQKWTVSRECFSLHHRIKDDKRFAEMVFSHPYLDGRFQNRRWVADGWFPKEATRYEMETELLSKVRENCVSHWVTIGGCL